MVYPYIINIRIYNEAGEVVSTVAEDTTSNLMSGVELYANGVTNPATVSGDVPLEIYLPGVQTPATKSTGLPASFMWTAINAQSQNVAPGKYYIKVEQTDDYGHVTSFIKDITVLNAVEYVELNIFNSSGEIVRSIRKTGPVINSKITLSMEDVITIGNNGTPVNIKYGNTAADYIQWDGRNQEGRVVSSGSYEVQVIVQTLKGMTMSSQSVVVLREEKNYLASLLILPNPYNIVNEYNPVVFKWTVKTGAETGSAYVKIYNLAGELVKTLKGKIEDAGGLTWDTYITPFQRAGTGLYICVLETRNSAGYINRQTAKLALTGSNY
jgi:hypothetical protein